MKTFGTVINNIDYQASQSDQRRRQSLGSECPVNCVLCLENDFLTNMRDLLLMWRHGSEKDLTE